MWENFVGRKGQIFLKILSLFSRQEFSPSKVISNENYSQRKPLPDKRILPDES